VGEGRGTAEPSRNGDALRAVRRRGEEALRESAHAVGSGIEQVVSSHHRRRLRKVGWEHAFDETELGFSSGATYGPSGGNQVEVLIDGSAYLPRLADEIAGAQSHVHLLGWCFSPELHLTREEEPVVLRNLLSDVARRIDVRLLVWEGAPFPVFRPTKRDVQSYLKTFTRGTGIKAETDSCVRLKYSHHEKVVVIDDRVAFVGGIDLTLDGGDPFDSPKHPSHGQLGWHDAAIRVEGPAVADVANHFRLRWRGPGEERLPEPVRHEPKGEVELQIVRTIPEGVFPVLREGDFSVFESYTRALRSAERFVYLENQFLWSPEIVRILVEKLRDPPSDDFRIVAVLPARPNDGADVSRGAVSALIHADDGNERFLACTLYARTGPLRDLVYVHSKIAIVDDRWLTIGSANLNERSMFNDSEVNVATLDQQLARGTRLRLWEEHLESSDVAGDPTRVIDELWRPTATAQLANLEAGRPLEHRLVMLPGVSRRARRISGVVKARVYDG
jgi:phosphatidylserine/phosphatidylglycerophosphate/cardiolipin synthase-like enzyme